ncbi:MULTISPECIES: pilus assembly protein PilM [unclassified Lysinibacillus]|uniref:type IV pilus biogenesis protein PilM n=1 Tax=unclassified Lysinibacillus TaxID=2636778 RepID=UPI00088F0D00|nr:MULTISPECIES: pilus assembly protein PilM [unclassified Lysinibacillus]SCX89154.1 type IV pilus assembly protein PilM [Lysinibacillus sp. SG9]SDB05866.1 type IV pilus assembly protein PilM [Lysinibacillus sp. TC-37]SFS36584.1 type IV pilus assembly protein PilM [Lysinibacillus sp. SG55]
MFKRKRKSHVSIELKDYVLRAIVAKGPEPSQWHGYEYPLPVDIVENGAIIDEVALFEIIKEQVVKWTGKKQAVRMFVPDTTVLLKSFEHPKDVKPQELRGYAEMELGHSIHLPFQDPLIDVYDPDAEDGKAILFAAPSEEITKIVGMLLDVSLDPEAADIRALCNIRLLEHMSMLVPNKTYLIADWSINELSISIFSNGQVEFLRYQSIETDMAQWQGKKVDEFSYQFLYNGETEDYQMVVMDQVLEIDRMMNFFKFSLHKGEKTVDEIIILGDNPLLKSIGTLLSSNLETPLMIVDGAKIEKFFPYFKKEFSTLLGLALKEVH